jgi:hypothetical protein
LVAQADDSVQQLVATHEAQAVVPYSKPQALGAASEPASAAAPAPASADALKYASIPIA